MHIATTFKDGVVKAAVVVYGDSVSIDAEMLTPDNPLQHGARILAESLGAKGTMTMIGSADGVVYWRMEEK